MPSSSFTVKLDQAAIKKVAGSTAVRGLLEKLGDEVAKSASGAAPRKSGRGADSVHSEVVMADSEYEARIGWTVERGYMRFVNYGTVKMKARNFLKKAFSGRYKTVKTWE